MSGLLAHGLCVSCCVLRLITTPLHHSIMKLQIQSRGSKKVLAEFDVTEKTSVQELKKQYARKCMLQQHS